MIYIGSDHGGYQLKKSIKEYMEKQGIEFEDVGTNSEESADYTDYAKKVCEKVLENDVNKGVLVCGTGEGMCITANRYKGIRAGLAYNESTAKLIKEHNNSNIICLGGRELSEEEGIKFFEIWNKTLFSNEERHIRRLKKADEL